MARDVALDNGMRYSVAQFPLAPKLLPKSEAMKHLRLPIAALLVACFFPFTVGRTQEAFFEPELTKADIDRTIGVDWYGVYLQNKKIGTCKIERARVGDTVVETFAMNMKLVAFEMKTEMKMARELVFEAKPPYRLLKANLEQSDAATNTKIAARRLDKGFEYKVAAAGRERVRQEPNPAFSLADNFAAEVWLRSAPKVGAKMLARDLDLEDWKLDPNQYTVKSVKTSLVAGVEVRYYEVETESRKQKITYLSRYDSSGKMLSSNVAIFELRKETEKQAKNSEFSQDLFVLGMVKIDRPIGFTTRLKELVLEVGGKDGDVLKNGPRQTVVVEPDGRRLIKLGKKYANEFKADAKTMEENLAETNAYVLSDAKVKALAKQAVGDAKTPEEKVKRIVAFVRGFLIPTETATLPHLLDLLEHKKGDCKSYALLTTTLCRAAGVPSREAAGLLYMGDDAKAFGGHAWNEVVLNGVWVPVDATLGQVELDAGHISFGEDRLAGGAMLQSLGKLRFKVVEAQTSK